MRRVLVVEDDPGIRANIIDLLEAEGYETAGAADGSEGIAQALARPPALVLCDITMPLASGYEVLRALQEHEATRAVPFVFLTAKADRGDVRLGMNLGADDYLTKPFTRTELLEAVSARIRRSARASAPPPPISAPETPSERGPAEVIVLDAEMRAVYEMARRAASSAISVLVLGETGVGKDVLARAVHESSPRAQGPFIALNCAALSETLLESELFGHEKGAFTGAGPARPGLFEAAAGGTVFLDEIGDIPMTTQVKLLRVLEERKVLRVGARTPVAIDVRFVSATNRDIEREAESGRFRSDLLFRLNGLTLYVPPLRDRKVEIRPLAEAFLAGSSRALGRPTPKIGDDALEAFLEHEWPGNVRELRHVMERAALLCTGDTVHAEHLPPKLAALVLRDGTAGEPRQPRSDRPPADARPDLREASRAAIEGVERRRIEDALAACHGNQTQAAAMLGISRRTLVSRLSQYDFPRPRKKP